MNSFRIAFSKVKFVQNYDCVKNKLANLRAEHNDYTKKKVGLTVIIRCRICSPNARDTVSLRSLIQN